MKHDELWNDTLDEALPRDLSAASLKAMRQAARGRILRRRITRASLTTAAALALLWLCLPVTKDKTTPNIAHAIVPAPSIRELSDQELLTALHEADIGIAIAGPKDHQEILLVANEVQRAVP